MRRWLLLLIVTVVLATLLPPLAAQQVLYRARIGGYTDAATFISTGPDAQHIAMLDGYEALAFPAQGRGKAPAKKLFDSFDLTLDQPFRGMAYISTEKLFVFLDNSRPDILILVDHNGKQAGTRTIKYPANDPYRANRFEGIVHLPADAALYPDHLVAISFCYAGLGPCSPQEMRILVMKRDGTVLKEFVPSAEILDYVGEFWGIGFQYPDKLLCSGGGPYVWKMDFDGNLVSPMAYTGADNDADEGVMQLPDGNVAVTNGFGTLRMFDSSLAPLPQLNRDYTIGLGLNAPTALAWNSDTNQLLVAEQVTYWLWSLSPRLNAKTQVFDMNNVYVGNFYPPPEPAYLTPFRFRVADYLSDIHQIAFTYVSPSRPSLPSRVRLVRFDMSGTVKGYDRLFDWDQPALELWTRTLSYVPPGEYSSTEEYILRSNTDPAKLYFLRPGQPAPDATLDLSSLGFSVIVQVQYFRPNPNLPGRLLVFGDNNRAAVTTLDGTLLSQFNYREKLRVAFATNFAYITGGPYAGAMALLAGDNGELVIFRLP